MRRWQVVLVGLAGALLVVSTVIAAVALLNGRDTAKQVENIVHQATCGGGHAKANLEACHRLCPNLSTISNVRCTPVPRGVVAGNGSNPSGQHSPAGNGGAPGSNGGNGSANGTNPGASPPPGNNAIGNALNDTTGAVNDALHNTNCIANGLLSQSC